MGQSPEELRREIEQTRSELGGTLDAIGDRVSPGRIMERRKNRFRDGLGSVRDRVMGPVESTRSTLASVPARAGDAGSGVAGSVADHASSAVDTLRSAPDAAKSGAQGSPLVAGALAFGVGFLAAVVFPGSEKEAELAQKAQQAAEPLKEEAQRVGQEVAANLQEPAQQAAESLKETATQGVQQVKEQAQSTAQETKETAASAAGEVKDQAQTAAQNVRPS